MPHPSRVERFRTQRDELENEIESFIEHAKEAMQEHLDFLAAFETQLCQALERPEELVDIQYPDSSDFAEPEYIEALFQHMENVCLFVVSSPRQKRRVIASVYEEVWTYFFDEIQELQEWVLRRGRIAEEEAVAQMQNILTGEGTPSEASIEVCLNMARNYQVTRDDLLDDLFEHTNEVLMSMHDHRDFFYEEFDRAGA